MNNIIKPGSFRSDLEEAKKSNKKIFIHNGAEYLVEYAEYLVEYMGILELQKKEREIVKQ